MSRRLLAVLLGLACLLGGRASVAQEADWIRLPDTIPDIPRNERMAVLNPAPVNTSWAEPGHHPLGIHLDNYELTRQQVEVARETGCRLVRLSIPMEAFQGEADKDWAMLDQVVSRLSRDGFEVLPVLTAVSASRDFYTDFCRQVAERYGATFDNYQILDDINFKIGIQSKDYIELLKYSREAIRSVDPDARIVCAGIRGSDLTFLQMLEDGGGMDSIDVLAFNLFPPADGIEHISRRTRSQHSLLYMQEIMEWCGERGKPVWVTSLGFSTSYDITDIGVDQVQQASAYARAVLFLGWLGVERIIIAAIQDSDASMLRPAQCCGLIDGMGNYKASYFALRTLNKTIQNGYQVLPDFRYSVQIFEQPEAYDVLMSQEFSSELDINPIQSFRVYPDPRDLFGFWFYMPEEQQYRLIYWISSDAVFARKLSLTIKPRVLEPNLRYQLLDVGTAPVEDEGARNFLRMQFLPLSSIPSVLQFEVNDNGR
ncbi:hypothetical protein KDL29_01430 [bacterium]|nr:hypothetical protein [bacterium]